MHVTEAIHIQVPRLALARGYSPDEVWASEALQVAIETDLPLGWMRAKAGPAGPDSQEYGLASFRKLGMVFFPDPPLRPGDTVAAVANGTVTGLLRQFVPEPLGYFGIELPMLRLFKPEARSVDDWFRQSTSQPEHFGACWADLTEMLYEPKKSRRPQQVTLGFSRKGMPVGAYTFIEHTPISFGWFGHRMDGDLLVAVESIQREYVEMLLSRRVLELGQSVAAYDSKTLEEIDAELGIEAFSAARQWFREALTEEERRQRIAGFLAGQVPYYRKVIAFAPVIRPSWWDYADEAEARVTAQA